MSLYKSSSSSSSSVTLLFFNILCDSFSVFFSMFIELCINGSDSADFPIILLFFGIFFEFSLFLLIIFSFSLWIRFCFLILLILLLLLLFVFLSSVLWWVELSEFLFLFKLLFIFIELLFFCFFVLLFNRFNTGVEFIFSFEYFLCSIGVEFTFSFIYFFWRIGVAFLFSFVYFLCKMGVAFMFSFWFCIFNGILSFIKIFFENVVFCSLFLFFLSVEIKYDLFKLLILFFFILFPIAKFYFIDF